MKKLLTTLVFAGFLMGPAAFSDWTEPQPEFVFARAEYTNREWFGKYWINSREHPITNPPWHHDYPYSDEMILSLLHELTGVRVGPESYKIVKLRSPELFKYPFLYLSEPGFLELDDEEIANLGRYIRRGGFIMADDFRTASFLGRGDPTYPEELEVLRHYLKLAVPERELVRLKPDDPIFHSFFDVDITTIRAPYGNVDFVPQFWGMHDEHGNLQLIANYNNDVGDFWKYLDWGEIPLRDTGPAIRLGINYVVYAMSH